MLEKPIPQNPEPKLTWKQRVGQSYFLFCIACSQTLLMFIMTPLRLFFREDDLPGLMKPMVGPMVDANRRLSILAGGARQLIEVEKIGSMYQLPCCDCGAIQTMPITSVMCTACFRNHVPKATFYTPGYVPAHAKCFTAACDVCRITLPCEYSGATIDEVNAEATKLGWQVEGSHFTCPVCQSDAKLRALQGVAQ